MRTGWRCRKMFDSITSTRLRSLFGRSCRKIDFQTCVSVSQFQNLTRTGSRGSTVLVSTAIAPLNLQECLGVFPLRELELEVLALVDQDLPVFREHDPHALEGARRRPFEVDACRPEAAAVARALEL